MTTRPVLRRWMPPLACSRRSLSSAARSRSRRVRRSSRQSSSRSSAQKCWTRLHYQDRWSAGAPPAQREYEREQAERRRGETRVGSIECHLRAPGTEVGVDLYGAPLEPDTGNPERESADGRLNLHAYSFLVSGADWLKDAFSTSAAAVAAARSDASSVFGSSVG